MVVSVEDGAVHQTCRGKYQVDSLQLKGSLKGPPPSSSCGGFIVAEQSPAVASWFEVLLWFRLIQGQQVRSSKLMLDSILSFIVIHMKISDETQFLRRADLHGERVVMKAGGGRPPTSAG